MTSTAEEDLKPTAALDAIVIHKVLSRGYLADAQVLLVLISTPAADAGDDADILVAIDKTEPIDVWALGGADGIESPQLLSKAELERLDLWPRAEGAMPFELPRSETRRYWLARFDFTDHPELRDQWSRWVQQQGADPAPVLNVIAWRVGHARKVDAKGTLQSYFAPLSKPVPFVSSVADVVGQPLFELGVLFVHGIGKHEVRETLVRWSEPIVKVWRDRWLRLIKDRQPVQDATRARITGWLNTHQLRSRAAIDGIAQTLTDFQKPADDYIPERPAAAPATLCFAATRAEQTLFAGADATPPSATLIRLSEVDSQAVLREHHVLFAEAYWAREAFPPTWSELYTWLTRAVPIAVWSRLQRLFRTRPIEIWRFAGDADSAFEKVRVAISAMIWIAHVAVMPALYIVFAVASQIGLALVALVGLLPISWLRVATRAVINALLGTLGQSFALQTSTIRRAAIVSSVTQSLDWLEDRCHRVVVLAHSQGAEITRLVFLDRRRPKVVRWYTAGSGIAPLSMLHPKSMDAASAKFVVHASTALFFIALLAVALLGVDAVPGIELGVRDRLASLARAVGWSAFAWGYGYFLLALAVAFLNNYGPPVDPLLRRSPINDWRDIFASQDPVPGGSLFDRFGTDFKRQGLEPGQSRIYNTRVELFDHTTYFENIEEFVAPVAMDLLRLAGLGVGAEHERTALKRAARRRDLRTWWNMLIWIVGLGACAGVAAWIAWGPAGRGPVWLEWARALWEQGNDFWDRLGLFWSKGLVGQMLTDLWPCVAIALVLGAWFLFCRALGKHSVDRLIDELADASRSPAAP